MIQIKLLVKKYIAARLAFTWMGEELPEQVDHPNGNSLDNRWLNLKSSNNAENQKNCSMRRTNTSGVCGVHWNKATGKWRARGMLGGKSHHLGDFNFDDLDLAATEVMEFRAENGFSERHGKELAGYMA